MDVIGTLLGVFAAVVLVVYVGCVAVFFCRL